MTTNAYGFTHDDTSAYSFTVYAYCFTHDATNAYGFTHDDNKCI